jgi:hypothetical protein
MDESTEEGPVTAYDETQSEQPATDDAPQESTLTEMKVEQDESGWHARAYDQNGEPIQTRSQDGFADKDAAMAWVGENVPEAVPVQVEAMPEAQPADEAPAEGHVVSDGQNVEIHPPAAEGTGGPTE